MIIPKIKKSTARPSGSHCQQAHAAHLPLSQSPRRGVGLSIFTRFLYTPTAGAIAALSLKAPSLSRGRGGWGKL